MEKLLLWNMIITQDACEVVIRGKSFQLSDFFSPFLKEKYIERNLSITFVVSQVLLRI